MAVRRATPCLNPGLQSPAQSYFVTLPAGKPADGLAILRIPQSRGSRMIITATSAPTGLEGFRFGWVGLPSSDGWMTGDDWRLTGSESQRAAGSTA
ncbi:hypothetical protein BO70DRAFT_359101 [Aspergillus heteromorphus CBS 117.55]|uniref:Uncharacterized protein n=1 Tax=Aspergillus heteromorphus CBS 117.55 TaxID=1448321 RepID=A0A317WW51_9EURO|nr:uncharacterized protein BO70DRAFT_359101 [Aspergillus heteromorphus CBS 117.55]PWY90111.1 hypothetical protein BO70DRAFT_359101 [Aspergillus heteromorphus CBS 117.55]